MAVLLEHEPRRRFEDLPLPIESDLERLLGGTVQVVPLNHAPPDLVHRVLRDGRLLFDRDPARRIRFEVKIRNELIDLRPILRAYRRRESSRR